MHALAASLSILCGAAGWFYLFHADRNAGLVGIEQAGRNRLRSVLRRVGGLAMLLLGAMFYVAFRLTPMQQGEPVRGAAMAWLAVFALLALVILLGGCDVYLTARLRRELFKRPKAD
jgi:UDP-N-acetylmuramyl pentapeptide phosphotransferase/UDP-N-acetylglucosamine-1-phosphate transferase